jgi:hypothetical protein
VPKRCFPSHSPYSSTLDRHARLCASRRAVLRGGALEPGACALREKGIGKPGRKERVSFSARERTGPYLPQAGPRFELGLLQAEHHPLVHIGKSVTKRQRRPGWVALAASRNAAVELAHAPPDEGSAETGLARILGDAIPALRCRRRRRRFDKAGVSLRCGQHLSRHCTEPDDTGNDRRVKRFIRKDFHPVEIMTKEMFARHFFQPRKERA